MPRAARPSGKRTSSWIGSACSDHGRITAECPPLPPAYLQQDVHWGIGATVGTVLAPPDLVPNPACDLLVDGFEALRAHALSG